MEFAERAAREATMAEERQATPAMLHAKLGNEKADKASIDRWTKQNLSPLFVRSSSGKTAVGSCAARTRACIKCRTAESGGSAGGHAQVLR